MGNTQFDYSQNDTRWRDVALGFSTDWYIGDHNGNRNVSAGCAVTSLADIASNFGHIVNPAEMNQLMKNRSLIDNKGDFTRDDILAILYSDIQYIESPKWPRDPAPLKYFDIKDDLDTEIMVLIDTSPAPGVQMHFCRVIGWDGANDVTVVDPWDGKRKGLSGYASRQNKLPADIIFRAIKYKRVRPQSPPPAPIPTAPAEPTPSNPATPAPATPTTGGSAPASPSGNIPPVAVPAPLPKEGNSGSSSNPPAGNNKPNLPPSAGSNEPPKPSAPSHNTTPTPFIKARFITALLNFLKFLTSVHIKKKL